MGCICSCFTGRERQETVDDPWTRHSNYPPFHFNISSYAAEMQYALKSQSSDEDVCPTCLEEYTDENPKIIAKCSHHYHLGCIYDWKERSETCPACRQVMIFDEAA